MCYILLVLISPVIQLVNYCIGNVRGFQATSQTISCHHTPQSNSHLDTHFNLLIFIPSAVFATGTWCYMSAWCSIVPSEHNKHCVECPFLLEHTGTTWIWTLKLRGFDLKICADTAFSWAVRLKSEFIIVFYTLCWYSIALPIRIQISHLHEHGGPSLKSDSQPPKERQRWRIYFLWSFISLDACAPWNRA
jgi:hypothetical protein